MNISDLRKYRLDFENFPIYNDKGIGISLFDVSIAFLGAYLLDKFFYVSKLIPCKRRVLNYYLLVIPFGILFHIY